MELKVHSEIVNSQFVIWISSYKQEREQTLFVFTLFVFGRLAVAAN